MVRTPETYGQALEAVLQEMRQVLLSKRQDYGPGNIPVFGERGVLVRASDKMARLKNLLWDNPDESPRHETLDDSWIDLANYAVLALLARRGWIELPDGEGGA